MRIKMLALMCGPLGKREVDSVHDLPTPDALDLIKAKAAVAVDAEGVTIRKSASKAERDATKAAFADAQKATHAAKTKAEKAAQVYENAAKKLDNPNLKDADRPPLLQARDEADAASVAASKEYDAAKAEEAAAEAAADRAAADWAAAQKS